MYSAHTYTRKIAVRIAILMALLTALIAIKISITREAARIGNEIRTHTESVAAVRAVRDESIALLSSFATVSGNEPRIRDAFPTADYIVPFTDALQAAAARSAARITPHFSDPRPTDRTLPPRHDDGPAMVIYAIDVSMEIDGDAKSLEQFLRELEALPYYLTIRSVTSSSNSESGWENSQRAHLSATLYAQH